MRESAKRKGAALAYRLYTITGIFFVFLMLLKMLETDYSVTSRLVAIFCLFTFGYFVYEVAHGFRSYFYAYALYTRERAPIGRRLWPAFAAALSLSTLVAGWFFIVFLEKNVHDFLDKGKVRGLIATNLVAGVVVIIPGTFVCYLLHSYRGAKRANSR